MLGGLLAVLSAATFALSSVTIRRGVITGTVVQGLAVTVPMGVPLFVVAALAAGSLGAITEFTAPSALYLALAGVFHFVLGRYCNYRAVSAMGANLAGPVEQASLLFSLGLAVWLLGETLTLLKLLGFVLILLGPTVMLRSEGSGGSAGFTPRYAEGCLFGGLSAVGYGVSPIFVRAALEGAGPAVSLAGGLLSYAAATVVLAPVLLSRRARRHVLAVDRRAVPWFAGSGVFVCVAQMIRYMALAVAPVTVVTPLLRTALVFRVVFGWVINRDHEVFGLRVVAGIAASLLGALALTLSTEIVLSLIPLPEALTEAARWTWPRG